MVPPGWMGAYDIENKRAPARPLRIRSLIKTVIVESPSSWR